MEVLACLLSQIVSNVFPDSCVYILCHYVAYGDVSLHRRVCAVITVPAAVCVCVSPVWCVFSLDRTLD